MLDNTEPNDTQHDDTGDLGDAREDAQESAPAAPRRRRRAASRPAGPPAAAAPAPVSAATEESGPSIPRQAPDESAVPAEEPAAAPAARTRRRRAVKETSSPDAAAAQDAPAKPLQDEPAAEPAAEAVEEPVAAPAARSRRRRAVKETSAPEAAAVQDEPAAEPAAEAVEEPAAAPAARSRRRRAVKETSAPEAAVAEDEPVEEPEPQRRSRRTRKRAESEPEPVTTEAVAEAETAQSQTPAQTQAEPEVRTDEAAEPEERVGRAPARRRAARPPTALFQPPVFEAPVFITAMSAAAEAEAEREDITEDEVAPAAEEPSRRRRRRRGEPAASAAASGPLVDADDHDDSAESADADSDSDSEGDSDGDGDEQGDRPARRRRRGGRRRRRGEAGDGDGAEDSSYDDESTDGASDDSRESEDEDRSDSGEGSGSSSSSRRRRRRRRRGGDGGGEPESGGGGGSDDPERTVVKVREPRKKAEHDPDEVQSIKGSTRLEAKKQRRREGREQGRRRVPIITEAEFLARREAVERVMIVRQHGDRTQIGVLEDDVLVEHFVNKEQATSYVGNVYLGKVQNVLPSMEAAFVDIGKGRNAVLYAGEVNFDALGLHGGPRRIETALKSGQSVLVQVTKDPIGHKGARLTSQVSLPGRYLVYVPEGSMTGISRKLPDTERARLKQILKKIVPEDAGVIVRTAAEGASEDELSRDVARLQAQWEEIQKKSTGGNGSAPTLLYGEPDMTVRVVRDIFNEDFTKVIVSGADAWETIHGYVSHVAPDLTDRLQKWTSEVDVFATYRIDEQLLKALDRKVWLPSGGSLVIDRTEAMVVVDVNTGKFTGQGGNLEETVTRNNLEAAEEIVRQLRLRDLGGIIVIDFIDMVLESNRDLVLRRLLECLGRDRTKHQVAEVTSLGLVQMTRKRVGQGLLESFSETCVHCNGRGVIVHMDQATVAGGGGGGKRRRKGKSGSGASAPQHEHAHEQVEQAEQAEQVEEPVGDKTGEQAEDRPEERPDERVEPTERPEPAAAPPARTRRRASRKAMSPAGPPPSAAGDAAVVVVTAPASGTAAAAAGQQDAQPTDAPREGADEQVQEPAKRTARKSATTKKAAAKKAPAKKTAAKKTTAKKTTAKKTAGKKTAAAPQTPPPGVSATAEPSETAGAEASSEVPPTE